MTTLLRIVRWLIDAVGLLTVALVFAVAAQVAVLTVEDRRTAEAKDLAYVMTLAGLDSAAPFTVVSSYRSGYSPLNGDGMTLHCLALESFEPDAAAAKAWVFGPDPSPMLNAARSIVFVEHDVAALDCFGDIDWNSADLGAKVLFVRFQNDRATDAELIFFYRPLRRLLYVSAAT